MRWDLISWVVLTLAFVAPSVSQPDTRRVLILHSFAARFAPDDAFARIVRAEVSDRSPVPVTFLEMTLQPAATVGALLEEEVLEYLESILAGQRLDLVVTISGPAANFARKYRERLFQSTPLLLAAVDRRWVEGTPLAPNETAVAIDVDVGRIVAEMLRVLPDTTSVSVVLGQSPIEQAWSEVMRRETQPFADRVTFVPLDHLPFAQVLTRAAALPPRSAILYLMVSVDAAGFSQTEEHSLAVLHRVASAPIFGLFDTQLGEGVVGGLVFPVAEVARDSATVALRILGGESPGSIRTAPYSFGPPTYDWRELQKWRIDESRLPAGSIVRFREPSVWDQYKGYVAITILVVALQSMLIAGLLVQRVRRRRMELAMRDLAGRLINAQDEERTRIARDLHDDLSQQLAGLGILLSGLRRRVGSADAQAEVDRTLATLQERTASVAQSVRTLSHELHPSVLEHAGLVATLRRHCDDLREHQAVNLTFASEGPLDELGPDVALCLYRVAQEALGNAIRHAKATTIRLSVTASGQGVELEVSDDGRGFVATAPGSSGLGLRSISERVRLVGGEADVDSRQGRGTRVHVRIPVARSRAVNRP